MANKNLFNSIKVKAPQRSFFDLTHDVKLTGNMGNLMPILSLETVPGDEIKLSADTLIRFAPMVAPVMHRMDVTIHYFFVPNRILWKNWDDFIAGKTSVTAPYITGFGPVNEGSLHDYLGIPTTPSSYSSIINALPYAAYQKIYNDYYRDQNLISPVISEDEILVDGNNNANINDLAALRKRAWEHDYFTSALPGTQYGNQATIPIEGTLSIPSVPIVTELDSGSIAINDLRKATRLQEWLELAMRAGRRYKETLLVYFGVDAGDHRLNRPEYITGVKTPVIVSEVLNTAGVTGSNPQGAMAGHGYAINVADNVGSYFCKEHGWIIGIMSIMPLPAYQNGIPRHFIRRNDKLDYYWPQFANIGEQEILNQELYVDTAQPNGTFGYVPRYSEYKYMPNRVAGNFRSSLAFWHLGRKFNTAPALNKTFIEMDSSGVQDIFAVKPTGSTHSIYAQVLNKIEAIRPMPKFGTPTL